MADNQKRTVSKPAFVIVFAIALLVIFGVGVLVGGVVLNKNDAKETATETVSTTEATAEATTEAVKLAGVDKVETKSYAVIEGETGFNGVITYFSTSDKDIDGYDIEIISPYDNSVTSETVDANTKAICFGTQDMAYTVKVRTYKGTLGEDDVVFSEWTQICDDDKVKNTKSEKINDAKWDEITSQKGVHPVMENN